MPFPGELKDAADRAYQQTLWLQQQQSNLAQAAQATAEAAAAATEAAMLAAILASGGTV